MTIGILDLDISLPHPSLTGQLAEPDPDKKPFILLCRCTKAGMSSTVRTWKYNKEEISKELYIVTEFAAFWQQPCAALFGRWSKPGWRVSEKVSEGELKVRRRVSREQVVLT